MIVYFADRNLNILATASTDLPAGIVIKDDVKTQETENGTASFSGVIEYNDENAVKIKDAVEPGNYVMRQTDDGCEVYTIVSGEDDDKAQDHEFYAEDGGLELLNKIALKWPDNDDVPVSPMTLRQYFTMFMDGTGFEIGLDESGAETKPLSFDQEQTVAGRLLTIAQEFGYEIDYRFEIDGFRVTKKMVNVYKKRGGDYGVTWRMNREIDRIVTKSTAENLASAFLCYGNIPDGSNLPITLADFEPTTPEEGYTIEKIYYADRDDWGYCLCSENGLRRWGTTDSGGNLRHVVKVFHYETLDQAVLYEEALKELKKCEDIERNWEIDIIDARDAKIGDTVYIVDETGRLYLSARLLKLEESISNGTKTATLGDYIIQDAGISQKVRELTDQVSMMVNPQIMVERDETNKKTIVTATDKNGTTSAEIYDGAKGDKGDPGGPGTPAPKIVSAIDQWCLSTSRTQFIKRTGSDWQNTIPAYVANTYYWTRTKTTFDDGTIVYSDPVFDLGTQTSIEANAAASAAAIAADTANEQAQASARAASAAQGAAETARNTAVSTANEALGGVNTVKKHFWYDDSGAHVSDTENSVAAGNSITIASAATVMMRNGRLVTSWTGSSASDAALNFYDCSSADADTDDLVASYARAGTSFYVNNNRAMVMAPRTLTFYDSNDGTKKEAIFGYNGVNLYAGGNIAANFAANSLNYYDGSAEAASADNLLAAYSKSGHTLYTRYGSATKNTRAMSVTASGTTYWDPSDVANSGTASQKKEAVYGSSGVELYADGVKSVDLKTGNFAFYKGSQTLFRVYGSDGTATSIKETKALLIEAHDGTESASFTTKFPISSVTSIQIPFYVALSVMGTPTNSGTVMLTGSSTSATITIDGDSVGTVSYSYSGSTVTITVAARNTGGNFIKVQTPKIIYNTTSQAASRLEMGSYPDATGGKLISVGNGPSSSAAANAFAVDWSGNVETGVDTDVTTISSIITSSTGSIGSFDIAEYHRRGPIAQLRIRWTNTSAISVPAHGNIDNKVVGKLAADKVPLVLTAAYSAGDNAGQCWYKINPTTREVSLTACEGTGAARTIDAGKVFELHATYIVA